MSEERILRALRALADTDRAAEALGLIDHERQANPSPHRIAEVVSPLQPEVIEKADRVAGHRGEVVGLRIVRLL